MSRKGRNGSPAKHKAKNVTCYELSFYRQSSLETIKCYPLMRSDASHLMQCQSLASPESLKLLHVYDLVKRC